MWLEAAVLVLVLVQTIAIFLLWLQSRHLQRALANKPGESHVPSLMIVNALNKIEHRLGMLEERAAQPVKPSPRVPETQVAAPLPSASQHPSGSHYELAQHLARAGGDVEQLMERCALSRNEAELVLRLYARRA